MSERERASANGNRSHLKIENHDDYVDDNDNARMQLRHSTYVRFIKFQRELFYYYFQLNCFLHDT